MEFIKKIRGSSRGITFTSDHACIGTKYRYIIDNDNQMVNIIADDNGSIKASKKRCGQTVKALFDLRSKKITNLIRNSSYMEIEEFQDHIIVRVYKKKSGKICLFRSRTERIENVLGIKAGEIIITNDVLQEAAGGFIHPVKSFGKPTLYDQGYFDYLSRCAGSYFNSKNKPNPEQLNKVYDVVSLFSGAGLFDKAWLEGGRFRFVFANDFCKDVIETYRHNIGDHIVCKDIRDVTPQEIPFSDVFVTSPCCQAFSNANRHNMDSEEAEKKRLLVEEVIRLANEKKPKVVVIENVPQMITKEKGIYIQKVIDGLPDYEVTVQVVNDSEVGGYSERKRCIVIASRIGEIKLPDMKVVNAKTVRDALEKVNANWYNYDDVTFPSEKTQQKMSYVKPGGNWRDIPPEIGGYGPNTQSNIMRRLDPDKPSISLSNFRKSNILHPSENRILSVSEAAAIMGLDKHFRFICDLLSAKQQMVANGVTQAIGSFVKNAVLKKLDLTL